MLAFMVRLRRDVVKACCSACCERWEEVILLVGALIILYGFFQNINELAITLMVLCEDLRFIHKISGYVEKGHRAHLKRMVGDLLDRKILVVMIYIVKDPVLRNCSQFRSIFRLIFRSISLKFSLNFAQFRQFVGAHLLGFVSIRTGIILAKLCSAG